MKLNRITLIFLAALATILPFTVKAHPGGTDANGGHYDSETGEYHYHHGMSAHQHYDIDGDGDIDCPYDYAGNTPTPNTSTGSGAGYYLSSGWMSDDEFDNLMNDSYREGHTEGYNSGYADGYDDGKVDGYNNAISKLEKEYEENLESAKDQAYRDGRNLAFFLSAIFGIPVVSHFAYVRCKKDYQNKSKISPNKQTNAKPAPVVTPKPSVAKPINFEPNYNEFVIIRRSSFISAVCHKENNLYVKLKTNECYLYYNVPRSAYREFLSAPSMGRFYNEKIANSYPYSQL